MHFSSSIFGDFWVNDLISTPFKEEMYNNFGIFKDQYQDFNTSYTSSPFVKASSYCFKAIEKIKNFVKWIFNTFFPETVFEGIARELCDRLFSTLWLRSEITSTYKRIINFIEIRQLAIRVKETHKELLRVKRIKHRDSIYEMQVKGVFVTSKIFAVPETIYKFTSLFGCEILKNFSSIAKSISLVLSTSSLVLHKHNNKKTIKLYKLLKTIGYRAFIKNLLKISKMRSRCPKLTKLPYKTIKNIARELKKEHLKDHNDRHVEKAKAAAFKAINDNLYRIILKDPKFIKKQFKVTMEKDFHVYMSFAKYPTLKDLFKSFCSKDNDDRRVKNIAKILLRRLKERHHLGKLSLKYRTINLFNNSVESVATLVSIFAARFGAEEAISPLTLGVCALLSVAKIVIIFYKHFQKKAFIESLLEQGSNWVTSR